MKQVHAIKEYHSIHKLLYSTEKQAEKIDRWNTYWTPEKKSLLKSQLDGAARENHFKVEAFSGYYQSLEKEYNAVSPEILFESFSALIHDF
jgi:hypothetical protein